MMSSKYTVTHVALTVIILSCLIKVGGSGLVVRDDQPPASRSLLESLNETEMACVSQQKVLHTDGQCHYLRHKGPCGVNEWLVLDDGPMTESKRRLSVCKVKPCSIQLQVFWPADGKCYNLSDKKYLCPYGGNILRSDSYGDGECGCEENYVRYEPDVVNNPNTTARREGICYELYRIGPCRGGTILHPTILPGFGLIGRCETDPCKTQNAQRPLSSTFAPLSHNGPCYKLGETGPPCKHNEEFEVHPLLLRPRCYSIANSVSTNSLFDDLGERCGGNIKECWGELHLHNHQLRFVGDMMGKPRPTRRSHPEAQYQATRPTRRFQPEAE